MSVLSGALRAAICAPEGEKFISADYSQIEARLVMWFADDRTGLDEFGGEGKIYEGMASEIYKIPKAKVGKDSFERFIGKQVILGSGFGMGAKKFVTSCKEKGGVDVEFKLAKAGITGYRERYEEVPKLWEGVERAAIHAVKYPGYKRKYKHVTYEMRGEHLYCLLPSGRELCYPYAHINVVKTAWGPAPKLHYWGINSYTNKWSLLDTWGGKLTENFVQAAARDIMAYGMLTTEKHGYTTLFTVHDESVAIVPKDFGSVKEYEELLCKLPKWAKGCPIEAEGWEGPRYRK
jgi:DNA polymerase